MMLHSSSILLCSGYFGAFLLTYLLVCTLQAFASGSRKSKFNTAEEKANGVRARNRKAQQAFRKRQKVTCSFACTSGHWLLEVGVSHLTGLAQILCRQWPRRGRSGGLTSSRKWKC